MDVPESTQRCFQARRKQVLSRDHPGSIYHPLTLLDWPDRGIRYHCFTSAVTLVQKTYNNILKRVMMDGSGEAKIKHGSKSAPAQTRHKSNQTDSTETSTQNASDTVKKNGNLFRQVCAPIQYHVILLLIRIEPEWRSLTETQSLGLIPIVGSQLLINIDLLTDIHTFFFAVILQTCGYQRLLKI